MDAPNVISSLRLQPNMSVTLGADGVYELAIQKPPQTSTMRAAMLGEHLFAGSIDFFVESCPNVMGPDAVGSSAPQDAGLWFTVNRCMEGSCEVHVPGGGCVVVEPGDVCVSYSDEMPAEYRYPQARYRGVELFVNTEIVNTADFMLFKKTGVDLRSWALDAGAAAIFSNDAELNLLMDRIGTLLEPLDAPRAQIAFLDFLAAVTARDASAARPRSFLTRGQMGIATSARNEIEADLAADHDVRDMAARTGIGVTTLNGYFKRVYGESIPAYLRQRRMERAAELLGAGTANVADVALAVGYANPSKFGAVFKRAFGCTPTEYRRRIR